MSMSRRRRADVDMVASNLERTCLVQGKREREGVTERRERGGRPVREREEEDRIRLVDKTGGGIGLWRKGEGGSCTSPAKKEELGTDATPLAVDQTPRRAVRLVLLTRKG